MINDNDDNVFLECMPLFKVIRENKLFLERVKNRDVFAHSELESIISKFNDSLYWLETQKALKICGVHKGNYYFEGLINSMSELEKRMLK